MNLKNARVLIIGGTSGIGLGVAQAVADRGGIPIVVSRNQSNVDRALAGLGENARGLTVDLGDPSSLAHLVGEVGRSSISCSARANHSPWSAWPI